MDIKQKLYTLIKEIGVEVIDNPHSRKQQGTFPFMLLRTNNLTTKTTNGLIEKEYIFLLDIYSNYSGEKEVYELYEKVVEAIQLLKLEEKVARAKDNGIRISDDNTLGPILKHGIMTINVKTNEVKGVV